MMIPFNVVDENVEDIVIIDYNNEYMPEEKFPLPRVIDIEWEAEANDKYFSLQDFVGTAGVHATVTDTDSLYLFELFLRIYS